MKKFGGDACKLLGAILVVTALVMAWLNMKDESLAEQSVATLGRSVQASIDASLEAYATADTDVVPDYKLHPEMGMPVVEVDGKRVVGKILVPSQGIDLPVLEQWDIKVAKQAPCRYEGSAYTDDLIIAGHNYKSHFQSLEHLLLNDEVVFTDMDGNEFRYSVIGIEEIPGEDITAMSVGDWDLTLFTCTYGGHSRVTIRCEKNTPAQE